MQSYYSDGIFARSFWVGPEANGRDLSQIPAGVRDSRFAGNSGCEPAESLFFREAVVTVGRRHYVFRRLFRRLVQALLLTHHSGCEILVW